MMKEIFTTLILILILIKIMIIVEGETITIMEELTIIMEEIITTIMEEIIITIMEVIITVAMEMVIIITVLKLPTMMKIKVMDSLIPLMVSKTLLEAIPIYKPVSLKLKSLKLIEILGVLDNV